MATEKYMTRDQFFDEFRKLRESINTKNKKMEIEYVDCFGNSTTSDNPLAICRVKGYVRTTKLDDKFEVMP